MKFKMAVIVICTMSIAVAGIAMLVSAANASTIEVAWGYSAEDQAGITKFRIYDKDNLVQVNNLAPDVRVAQFETENECNAWHLVAVAGEGENEIESDRSNSAPWCPDAPDIPVTPTPGTFTITGSVTITPTE